LFVRFQYRRLLFCSPTYSITMATTAPRPPQKLTASEPLSTPTPEVLAAAAAAAAAACQMIVRMTRSETEKRGTIGDNA
jgi:hypothetical protein